MGGQGPRVPTKDRRQGEQAKGGLGKWWRTRVREAVRPGHRCPVGRWCQAEEPGRGQVAGALNTSIPGHCLGSRRAWGTENTAEAACVRAAVHPQQVSRRPRVPWRGRRPWPWTVCVCVNVECDALPTGFYWFSLD